MKRKQTRTQVIERVASLAMRLGGRHLADYGATRSRHDFTQRQLMACLILRAYLKTTYRGVLELLVISPNLRAALGLADKLPHYTTLQKFSARSQVLAIADAMIRTIGRSAGAPEYAQGAAAMDATGLETTTASAHFQSRSGRPRRKWVKVSTIILCGSLLPLSLVLDWGPGNDKCQAEALLNKASEATLPAKLYADAGYDAEWVHDQCRLDWGVESVIKPARSRADGSRGGFWRSQMSADYLKRKGYGSRWAVEAFFSGLKRTMGSTLNARKPSQLLAEAAFKVLAYTLRR
jgi:Transposase DDE domain